MYFGPQSDGIRDNSRLFVVILQSRTAGRSSSLHLEQNSRDRRSGVRSHFFLVSFCLASYNLVQTGYRALVEKTANPGIATSLKKNQNKTNYFSLSPLISQTVCFFHFLWIFFLFYLISPFDSYLWAKNSLLCDMTGEEGTLFWLTDSRESGATPSAISSCLS